MHDIARSGEGQIIEVEGALIMEQIQKMEILGDIRGHQEDERHLQQESKTRMKSN